MPCPPVYVADAAVQPGPLRTRALPDAPLVPLREMMLGAARTMLEANPDLVDAIDGVHVGSMGIMQPHADDRLHVSHLGHHLQRTLGLHAVGGSGPDADDAVHTEIATSDAGAAIFQRAVRHLRAGRHRTVLVVAGEQMLGTGALSHRQRRDLAATGLADVLRGGRATARLPAHERDALRAAVAASIGSPGDVLDAGRLGLDAATIDRLADLARRHEDRGALQRAIRSVVSPGDTVVDGLTMLHVGDLLMDAIVRASGADDETWREAIATTTLRKYAWGQRFDAAFQTGVEARTGRRVTSADLARERLVTPWFTKHDVGAPCNGATAVILTTDADVARRLGAAHPNPCRLRVDGIGEGHAPLAVSDRGDMNGVIDAMRHALRGALGEAGAPPSAFVAGGDGTAVLHDAFPSIELSFLALLHRSADPFAGLDAVIQRAALDWLGGRSNPLGGLCATGHAVGNSGLLQIAKVHFAATRRSPPVHIEPDTPVARQWLATSVGAAVTNVRATVLTVTDVDAPRPASPTRDVAMPALFGSSTRGPVCGTRVDGTPVALWQDPDGLRLVAEPAPERRPTGAGLAPVLRDAARAVRSGLPDRVTPEPPSGA